MFAVHYFHDPFERRVLLGDRHYVASAHVTQRDVRQHCPASSPSRRDQKAVEIAVDIPCPQVQEPVPAHTNRGTHTREGNVGGSGGVSVRKQWQKAVSERAVVVVFR